MEGEAHGEEGMQAQDGAQAAEGRYAGSQGHEVIANARWGLSKTWSYDYDGIPKHSMLAIGTVGSGTRYVENRPLFEAGLHELVQRCKPHTLVIYGSANLFPDIVDNYVSMAQRFLLKGGDSVTRRLYQLSGTLNGEQGIFEWIVEPGSPNKVTHRRFIKGGKITGKPNQHPKG